MVQGTQGGRADGTMRQGTVRNLTRRPVLIGIGLLAVAPLAVWLGLSGTHALYARHAGPPLPLELDFDRSVPEGWRWTGALQFCCDHSAVLTDDPENRGNRVLAVTLRRDDPFMKGSRRAEFRTRAAAMGGTYAYHWRSYVPPDWQRDPLPVSFAQWHNVQDLLLSERGVPAPLQFWIVDDRVEVVNRSDAALVSSSYLGGGYWEGATDVLWSGPLRPGWTDWSVQVRWSYAGDGRVQVRRNGQLILDREGPNTFNDMTAPYMKLGLYVWDWAGGAAAGPVTERTMLYDDLSIDRIGDHWK